MTHARPYPFITGLTCVQCGRRFDVGEAMWCPDCGIDEGILDVEFDLAGVARSLTRESIAGRPHSHWRYQELLPIRSEPPAALAHIGWTPLIEAPRLAAAIGVRRLRLKDDGRNASGSFKDRPSSLAVAMALEAGATAISCASTGNAASSLACSAAAAGIKAYIFVSQRIPAGKLAQLLAYGATVFKVRGSYDDAWRMSVRACEQFGWYNRNCAINPWLVEGKKTGGLEIAEQCADDAPDWVSASVGDGCSIAGVAKGLEQMHAIGFTNWRAKVLGVQAEGVAPITEAYAQGMLNREGNGDTYADSINCPVPRNWRKAVDYVKRSGGAYINISDEAIRAAVRTTGALTGVFAEPAAAAAVAGVAQAVKAGVIAPDASVVAIISGNGLKDTAGAMSAVGEPYEIDLDFTQVEAIVARG